MINQEGWVMIRNLYEQGINKTEIARIMDMTRKTISNNLKKKNTPKYIRNLNKVSILEDYKGYINQRLNLYNLTGTKIYDEIKKQGYKGGYGIVNLYVKDIKKSLKNQAFLRFETIPGEQAQVDWGYLGEIYDKEKRILSKNLTCQYKNKLYLIDTKQSKYLLRKATVLVTETENNKVKITYKGKVLKSTVINKFDSTQPISRKEVNNRVDEALHKIQNIYYPPTTHPYKQRSYELMLKRKQLTNM